MFKKMYYYTVSLKFLRFCSFALLLGVFLASSWGIERGRGSGELLYEDELSDLKTLQNRYVEILGPSRNGADCSITSDELGLKLEAPFSSSSTIRTKDPKAFQDDGTQPIVYSVREGGLPGTTCISNSFLVRLDGESLDNGYEIIRYYDSNVAILSIQRHKDGEKEILFSSNDSNSDSSLTPNEMPELANFRPDNLLEVKLENLQQGVKITVFYNETPLKTLIDESPSRVTTGTGLGLKVLNNGVDRIVGGRFAVLKVVRNP
jgi:hypothetical protein